MRRRRDYWHKPVKEFEDIAGFGDARIVRDRHGRFHLHGGTEEQRKQAHDWMLQYCWPADTPKPNRYPGVTISS